MPVFGQGCDICGKTPIFYCECDPTGVEIPGTYRCQACRFKDIEENRKKWVEGKSCEVCVRFKPCAHDIITDGKTEHFDGTCDCTMPWIPGRMKTHDLSVTKDSLCHAFKPRREEDAS